MIGKKRLLTSIVSICAAVALGVGGVSHRACAETTAVAEVEIVTPLKASLAEGLLLIRSGTIRRPDLQFVEVPGRGYIVKVPFDPAEVDNQAMVTAIIRADDGQIAFGPVKALSSQSTYDSFLDLPACSAEGGAAGARSVGPSVEGGKIALFEKIIQVRMQRRDLMREQLSHLLDDATRENIARLEQRLGLQTSPPLTAALPAAQIAERVQRILIVLRNYDLKRQRQRQAQPPARPAAQ